MAEEREYSKPGETLNYPTKGIIAAIYPTNDPNNGQGVILCDVVLVDTDRKLFRVPIFTPAFHADDAERQIVAERKRNIYDGESWTPAVGTICVVQWLGPPPNMQPFISHFIPTNLQSLPDPNRPDRSLFPKQAQAVTVFDEQGTPKEEFRSRLQPTESETPRWTRVQNGSCIEIDNRGNINLQSTIARDKIQKERYSNYDYSKAEIKETPDPQGNVVVSTRGARKGNIGLITGKIKTTELRKTLVVFDAGETREIEVIVREALDETNEDGSILLQTSFAKKGNVTYDLRDAEQGNYQVLTGKLNGQIEPPGNITLKTLNALLGSILLRTQSKEGNITLDTESSEKGDILCRTAKAKSGKVTITTELAEDGTILLKDKKGSFIKLDTVTGNIEIEAAQEIIFRATKIRGIQK